MPLPLLLEASTSSAELLEGSSLSPLGRGDTPAIDARRRPRFSSACSDEELGTMLHTAAAASCHVRSRSDGRGLGQLEQLRSTRGARAPSPGGSSAGARRAPSPAATSSDLAARLTVLQRRYTGWAKVWRLYVANRPRLLVEAGLPPSVTEGGLTLGEALVERRRAIAAARRVRNRFWLWLTLLRTPALRQYRVRAED
mmetsp:Transcript_43802/g.102854  ORF Transcript_43802/g.102854 Transcript_43802/m.102854 type:complete len:198 (+) Transcript_43802:557-1150(+)